MVEIDARAEVGNGEGLLVFADFEVDPRCVGLEVQAARRRRMVVFGGERRGDPALEKQALHVPLPAGVAHHVERRTVEVQSGKVDARPPQTPPAKLTINPLHPGEGFGAKCRVLADQGVGDGKSGTGEQVKGHRAESHRTLQRPLESRLKPPAVALGADE